MALRREFIRQLEKDTLLPSFRLVSEADAAIRALPDAIPAFLAIPNMSYLWLLVKLLVYPVSTCLETGATCIAAFMVYDGRDYSHLITFACT